MEESDANYYEHITLENNQPSIEVSQALESSGKDISACNIKIDPTQSLQCETSLTKPLYKIHQYTPPSSNEAEPPFYNRESYKERYVSDINSQISDKLDNQTSKDIIENTPQIEIEKDTKCDVDNNVKTAISDLTPLLDNFEIRNSIDLDSEDDEFDKDRDYDNLKFNCKVSMLFRIYIIYIYIYIQHSYI